MGYKENIKAKAIKRADKSNHLVLRLVNEALQIEPKKRIESKAYQNTHEELERLIKTSSGEEKRLALAKHFALCATSESSMANGDFKFFLDLWFIQNLCKPNDINDYAFNEDSEFSLWTRIFLHGIRDLDVGRVKKHVEYLHVITLVNGLKRHINTHCCSHKFESKKEFVEHSVNWSNHGLKFYLQELLDEVTLIPFDKIRIACTI